MLPTTSTRLRTKIANRRFTISSRLTKRSINFTTFFGNAKMRFLQDASRRNHANRRVAAVLRVARARLACWRKRLAFVDFFCKDCSGETPKPTRETRGLPGNSVAPILTLFRVSIPRAAKGRAIALLPREVGYFLAVKNYDVAIIVGGPAGGNMA